MSYPHVSPMAYLGNGVRLEHVMDPAGLIVEPNRLILVVILMSLLFSLQIGLCFKVFSLWY